MEASYIKLYKSGELRLRARIAYELLKKCSLCPRNCGVNRTEGETGFCHSRVLPVVSSYTRHLGEEPVISGTMGAGNVFFGNCNLRCIFCQNHEISQNPAAEIENEVSHEKLAQIMIRLKEAGCHNIGLISPTHFVPQIIAAINIAAENGLDLPIVYNSNGYDSADTLKLLDGIVDIYLPDFKYGNDKYAEQFSKAADYFASAKNALKEMYRQVGSSLIIEDGLLKRGLIIRHLVLPNDLSETEAVFKFISRELDKNLNISLMAQYYPAHNADKEILLSRTIREREYEKAIELLGKYDLDNGWMQEPESVSSYRPSFNADRENPFNNNF